MLNFLLDLEGTVIENLQTKRLLEFNIKQIAGFMENRAADGEYKIVIYTWGWKHRNEINQDLLNLIYRKFESCGIDQNSFDGVYIKEDAVNLIANDLWGNLQTMNLVNEPKNVEELKEWLLRPGAMTPYGYTKVAVAEEIAKSYNGSEHFVLIDDMVAETDELRAHYELEVVNPNRMAVRINNNIDPTVTLYSPDGYPIGEIQNESALMNVRVQICKQHLTGFYCVYKGQKIHIDGNGNLEDWPKGCFDYCLDAAGELLINAKSLREQVEDYKKKHPELVKKSCQN